MKVLGWQLILICLCLSACGTGLPSSASKLKTEAPKYSFYIAAFSPPAGVVAAAPVTIVVGTNAADLNPASVLPLTHYSLNCAGVDYAASTINFTPGYGVINVNFQAINGLSSGSQCIFTVSQNIQTAAGQNLEGLRSALYTIQ